MEKSKMQLIKEWIETCPLLNGGKINVDYLEDEIDNYSLYKYGLYLCTVYADIKGLSKRKLNTKYQSLPITSRKDININGGQISEILGRKPGEYIKEIMEALEIKILNGKLNNSYEEIKEYITHNYMN